MRLGRRGDDAGRRALLQPLEEELAEQKRRQVVDRPGQLDAVLRQLPCSVHRAGVVDEHIQLWIGASTSAANLRTEACDERSAMNVATVAPFLAAALVRADAMRILVLLRPTIARFAPSAASASAAANPIPSVAPVIRICLSFTAQQSTANGSREQPGRSDCDRTRSSPQAMRSNNRWTAGWVAMGNGVLQDDKTARLRRALCTS